MRIIMLGAPGSGKGTQARFLIEKYKIYNISIGDILRDAVKKESCLGEKIKFFIEHGKLIPDKIVISLMKENLNKDIYSNSFLFDGFPRTLSQAIAIKELNIDINYVFNFIVPDNFIINRIIGRRIHPSSGRIYHVKFNPPKHPDRDNITGEPLIIRKDDNESIVRNRLIEYHKHAVSLINFYRKESSSTALYYASIDGTRNINKIRDNLFSILDKIIL